MENHRNWYWVMNMLKLQVEQQKRNTDFSIKKIDQKETKIK